MSLTPYDSSFYERFVLAKQKYRKKWEKIHSRYSSKVSFLLIPHSEHNVFKVEITFYMLFFFGILSFILICISFGFLTYFSFFFKIQDNFFNENNRNKSIFLYYDLLVNDLNHSLKLMQKETEDLNVLAWDEIPWKKIITQDYRTQETEEETKETISDMQTNLNLIEEVVNGLAHGNKKLRNLKPVFQNAMDYLETRDGIFQSLPRGRPLQPGLGFVSSTFGDRVDPVPKSG